MNETTKDLLTAMLHLVRNDCIVRAEQGDPLAYPLLVAYEALHQTATRDNTQ